MELLPRFKDQIMVQEVPSPSRNLLNPRGIPTTPKSSTSAGMSLNYLLRTKESRCSLGRPPQRVEQNAHPLTARHPAFENSSRPILNLISTIRSKYSVSEMQKMAYRLRRETTVVATQEAMGSVEEVYRTVFRDTRSRPTFLIGVTSHGFWEYPSRDPNRTESEPNLFHCSICWFWFHQTWPSCTVSQYRVSRKCKKTRVDSPVPHKYAHCVYTAQCKPRESGSISLSTTSESCQILCDWTSVSSSGVQNKCSFR